MMTVSFQPDHYYHVYNRGVSRTNIFIEDRNYAYFLQLYAKHVSPVADTLAYCLLRNHFHFFVRIRNQRRPSRNTLVPETNLDLDVAGNQLNPDTVSHAFNNWLNAYAKALNKGYGRTGSLFEHHSGRLLVDSEPHFVALIRYIHHNPQKHEFVSDFRDWFHSSYQALLSAKPTQIERGTVLDWFGGREEFQAAHAVGDDEASLAELIGRDEG